jgi:hypothetical protein
MLKRGFAENRIFLLTASELGRKAQRARLGARED